MTGVMRGLAVGLALAIHVLATQVAQAQGSPVFDYHGWYVDLSGANGKQTDEDMIRAVKRQLDIVEHVGLKPQVVTFMRTIRIWAKPDGKSPGHYSRATGVDLRVGMLEPTKPIILHELLHAYHDQKLPDGFNNRDIWRFYERGKSAGWPANSYMLSNNREFFATTASVYLFGDIPRPPESRSLIRSRQPAYYQWLAELFDDGRPRP